MAIESFDDLLRQVREHPEWRQELRRELLTDDLLAVPSRVDTLTEQMTVLTARVDTLTEQMTVLTARVDTLTQRLDALAEQMTVLTSRVDTLRERVETLTQQISALVHRLDALVEQVSEMAGHVEWLKGDAIERRYRERAGAYFGRIARRIHTLSQDEIEDLLERAVDSGALQEPEAVELRLADAIIRGRRDDQIVYLVVEASWGVGIEDVKRAQERAELLARTGVLALGVVAGTWINPDARRAAPQVEVWQVADGVVTAPGGAAA